MTSPLADSDVALTRSDLALAVDIGGTKIAAALVDADGVIRMRRSVATPRVTPRAPRRAVGSGQSDPVWHSLAELILGVLSGRNGAPVVGIGVGCAGPIDLTTATVSPVNITTWRDFPLVERLADLVPRTPIRLAGDGMCAAAGEHWRGAGRGFDDVLVVVVSTGVGGGLVQSGRLFAGPTGNAGHIGHMVVDVDGEPCACGGRGCVETIASGPSMVAWAVRSGWRPRRPQPSAVDLAAAARAGDSTAKVAFRRAGRGLAAGLVSVAAACDLSLVVIGGGVVGAADLLLPPVLAGLREFGRLGFLRDLVVLEAALGPAAGLVGAAALVFAPDEYATAGVLEAAHS